MYLVPQRLTIPGSETPYYPKLYPPRSHRLLLDEHEETKMLPVQDHLSLISFQYFAKALQPNNLFHSVVTSPLVY